MLSSPLPSYVILLLLSATYHATIVHKSGRVATSRADSRPPFSAYLRCPSCAQPAAYPWRYGAGCGAHVLRVGREDVVAMAVKI